MSRVGNLLEVFYFRAEPLGIALFGPQYSSPLSFGRPATSVVEQLGITGGLMQKHLGNLGLSIFFAKLEGDQSLVAQYSYEEIGHRLYRPWLRFVRLATALTLSLDAGPFPESPLPGVAVQRPSPQGPPSWLRVAHAKPESETDDEPA